MEGYLSRGLAVSSWMQSVAVNSDALDEGSPVSGAAGF